MNEFELIDYFFTRYQTSDQVILGVGDDAAILRPPDNMDWVSSVDTLNAGVHFPENTPPEDIGYKALAVSLSDMAAMGAKPIGFLLSLSLPAADEKWLHAFSNGLYEIAQSYETPLIGGDTTRGPLSIGTVVQGIVPTGTALCRHTAKPHDIIYVTGTLGDAGLALDQLKKNQPSSTATLARLNRPTPRVEVGLRLRQVATAAIDVSDGLAADLGKILSASGVAAQLNVETIPTGCDAARAFCLNAGDDFELCFTAPPSAQATVRKLAETLRTPITAIGQIIEGEPNTLIDAQGKPIRLDKTGYMHYS